MSTQGVTKTHRVLRGDVGECMVGGEHLKVGNSEQAHPYHKSLSTMFVASPLNQDSTIIQDASGMLVRKDMSMEGLTTPVLCVWRWRSLLSLETNQEAR